MPPTMPRRGFQVCLAKFRQNPEILKAHLATGDAEIIEDAEHDPYWGWGASKVGKNALGQVHMLTRKVLRAESNGEVFTP